MTDDPRAADDADDEAAPGDDGEGLSDPLDELGADEEPVDDPFAQLDADADAADPDAPGDDAFDDEAFTDSGSDAPAGESEGPLFGEAKPGGGEAGERDDPFDELGPSTGEADLDEAFERMDVGELSDEDVWKSLDEDDGLAAPGAAGFDSAGPFGGADVDRVISKQAYCQQCPHFSAPPEATCTHEGTTILEAIGFDEFRVRNCPMVDDDPTFDAADAE